MIGYIVIPCYMYDGPAAQDAPSVVHRTQDAAEAEASTIKGGMMYGEVWEVQLPDAPGAQTSCACRERCGDVEAGDDAPMAVCKGLRYG